MSVPPRGPEWARPDPSRRSPDEQDGPYPRTGAQNDPGRMGAAPPPPGQRPGAAASGSPQPDGVPERGAGATERGAAVPPGAPGAGQQAAPRWGGRQQAAAGQEAGPEQPAAMLGDEQVAGAAKAAGEHAHNRIVDTSAGRTHGLNKCPACGGTDIHYSISTRALVCGYCRNQWNEDVAEEAFGLDSSISDLQGHTMASGTADVQEDLTVMTLKCQGCGAEVVINVDQELQARCHWCRQTLSVNSQIPNGAVPDAVLPFLLTREQAIERIEEFVGKRRTFANARFKKEFVPDNVMGVYIPYMVVDGNMHAQLRGTGEVTTRQYTVRRRVGENNYVTETYYDADVYRVQRAFDILVDDLTVESAERFNARDNTQATNNVLHAVQPYDTENAVTYNSNYLKNFTSERRDLDIRDVDDRVEEKFLSIARAKAKPTVGRYDRGVQWQQEGVAVHGTRWVAVYVPVWLYSYAGSATGEESLTHYIAVNARNGNTMGSVPVSHPKIFALSCFLGGVAAVVGGVVGVGVFVLG